MSDKQMEVFVVKYRQPKFGTENEFSDDVKTMMVATAGGRKDAEEACRKYHPGCKIDVVMTRLEELAGVEKVLNAKRLKKKQIKQKSNGR